MSQPKASARTEIEKLVRYFEQNVHQLKAPNFNEAQARQFLIDPFFEALGWDISNKAMAPPFRLEVLPEGRVKTSIGKGGKDQTSMFPTGVGVKEEMKEYSSMLEYIADDEYKAEHKMASKKPDYRFRIQGSTKFFVEAKKPSVDLTNHDAVFQIKRYGFSARVPVSILTDFEEFRVFDCTRKPFYDKPKVGVLKEFDLKYSSYLDSFDLLYDTFSREAVIGGSIEALQKKYLEKKKGEFALDRAFLDDLSEWRVELAQDIAKHPKNRRVLNSFTLNECVQRILDRIVFLRVVQDRNIDPDEELLALTRLWDSHPGLSLYEMFNKLIEKKRPLYNGLLFATHECEQLEVGNKILEKIFKNINYPLSPYNFDEIGVEILGSIYERFLGKTIRLTQKQVRVEDKPEVRKAGGVYYTPQYIVNYIVENTVGKMLYDASTSSRMENSGTALSMTNDPQSRHPERSLSEAKTESKGEHERKLKLTPRQVSKLKIIDIACGSGSFLLGAFQKLIDYHEQWYTQHPDEVKEVHGVRDVYEDAHGRLVLSARKKREILVNNLYGVDIDAQAVEVTQMSLYLKVLENENDATLNKPTMLALHEVLLPPLKNNIKCGNSLIGTDIGAQGDLFDSDATRKINPFDWKTEFSEIMDAGGFDCVIGNPPYIPIEVMSDLERKYFQSHYSQLQRKYDSSVIFILVGLQMLKRTGLLGFISSITWQTGENYSELRRHLFEKGALARLINLPFDVFEDAYVDTGVYVLSGQPKKSYDIYRFPKKAVVTSLDGVSYTVVPSGLVKGPEYKLVLDPGVASILIRLSENGRAVELGSISVSTQGLAGNMFKMSPKPTKKSSYRFLESGQVHRYELQIAKVSYVDMNDKPTLSKFYEADPKILIRRVISRQDRILASYVEEEMVFKKDINPFLLIDKQYSPLYVLALLNSKFISHLYMNLSTIATKDDFRQTTLAELRRLPICTIDFSKPDEKKMHDDLVKLVEKMLDLHKQLQKASFDSEKEPIERQIEAADKKIDEMVYKLYELTEEEIAIVEGRTTEEAGVEQKWEASFASSQEKLAELASKALKEHKSGKTTKMGFDEL